MGDNKPFEQPTVVRAVDALVEIIASMEERVSELAGTLSDQQSDIATLADRVRGLEAARAQEILAGERVEGEVAVEGRRSPVRTPKQYFPREGTQIHAVLSAMVSKGGSWGTGRVLDALDEAGLPSHAGRPESVASGILQTLRHAGFVSKGARGYYLKPGIRVDI